MFGERNSVDIIEISTPTKSHAFDIFLDAFEVTVAIYEAVSTTTVRHIIISHQELTSVTQCSVESSQRLEPDFGLLYASQADHSHQNHQPFPLSSQRHISIIRITFLIIRTTPSKSFIKHPISQYLRS
jgi:hypothetical protein